LRDREFGVTHGVRDRHGRALGGLAGAGVRGAGELRSILGKFLFVRPGADMFLDHGATLADMGVSLVQGREVREEGLHVHVIVEARVRVADHLECPVDAGQRLGRFLFLVRGEVVGVVLSGPEAVGPSNLLRAGRRTDAEDRIGTVRKRPE
jgi:hypothetical protein